MDKIYNNITFGLGLQKTFYPELGVTRLKYFYNDLGYASTAHYAALEFIPPFLPDKPLNIYGLKIG